MKSPNTQHPCGAADSLEIVNAAQHEQRPLVVVTPDMSTTIQLTHELHFFAKPESKGSNNLFSYKNQQDKEYPENKSLPILTFPDRETLPYDHFSPHRDITSQRLMTLYQLPLLTSGILVVPITTLMHPLPPKTFVESQSFVLGCGDTLETNTFCQRLANQGYHRVAQVMEHGEFSVRGSIIDVFPMGSEVPYRMDLFDNEVDTMRVFDPDSQRTIRKIDHIQLLPAREFPLTEESITHFRQAWRDQFSGNPTDCPMYESVSLGESAAGIEYYLPLFFKATETLLDYFPKNTTLVRYGDVNTPATHFWNEIKERYDQLHVDNTRPLLPPPFAFLTVEQVFAQMKTFPHMPLNRSQATAINTSYGQYDLLNDASAADKIFSDPLNTEPLPNLAVNAKAKVPYEKLSNYLQSTQNRILFCAESAGRREVLLETLRQLNVIPKTFESWYEFIQNDAPVGITLSNIERGFTVFLATREAKTNASGISLITEAQLFEEHVAQRRLRKHRVQDPEAIIRDLTELSIGSPVVHIDHGIGHYQGLSTLTTDGHEAEYLMLEYAGNDKLYVPVTSLHLITRFTGASPENTPLHRLGSSKWQRAKRKAAEQIRDVAAELLKLYAKRNISQGFTYEVPTDYQRFASAFPFEETPDQHQAIDAVIKDLTSPRSTDRLICGDVGFGKTEVAMRAAFIAAQNSKQVAILVPTTILAEQHGKNFQDRFADWPIRIGTLSRFRSAKEQKALLNELKDGKIDIIIGTHRLLQPDVVFKNLGLLIIDEEHRFGVRHKERIKALRINVGVLTLTATPIPRTLNMSLAGVRDLSIIATPPAQRLAIKTFVKPFNSFLIREAILREILRGGQVYFLHNEVKTIQSMADKIQKLVPDARITIAHGQMRERELERVMADFYHLRFNVLVCTTIIESGIDIPTANTIIINRADYLGMAQLHQIRGRVGRSHHQAYAYLLTPPEDTSAITRDAAKRLKVIAETEDLGAGFTLATHDLEIRGTGDLLGESQSGHIQAIGFSLYMDLLDSTIKALKSGKEPNLDEPDTTRIEMEFNMPALIPSTYLPDIPMRLSFYKRIANAQKPDELNELQVEMIDRFGLLPPQIKHLFHITALKFKAQPIGVRKINVGMKSGHILFEKHPQLNVEKLLAFIQAEPENYQLKGADKLQFRLKDTAPEQRIAFVETLLDTLREP